MGEGLAWTNSSLCFTVVLDTGDTQSNQGWCQRKLSFLLINFLFLFIFVGATMYIAVIPSFVVYLLFAIWVNMHHLSNFFPLIAY